MIIKTGVENLRDPFLLYEKGMETVYASFFTGNEPSRRVMEKCGMTFSRFSEKELSYLGVERDLIYYVIRKERRPDVHEHCGK